MNTTLSVVCIGIICLAMVAFSGCLGSDQNTLNTPTIQPTSFQTPVPVGHHVFTEQLNNATVYLNRTNTLTLTLNENPTTGYSWNISISAGLNVTNDSYLPSDST